MGLYDYNLYSVIKRNARVYNERVALISENNTISHQQFLEKVDRLSQGLISTGVEKGDRIGVVGQNCLEYIYLYGAAAKTGAIILPVNWRLNSEELEYVITDGAPKIIFASSELHDVVASLIAKFSFIKRAYSFGQTGNVFESFDDLMEKEATFTEVEVHSSDDYVIIYTAAVQGRLRGAVLSHQNVMISNLLFMYHLGLIKTDAHLLMLPLFHIFGLSMALSVMQAGGANIIMPKFDVDVALRHIQEDKTTILGSFPPMLKALLDKAEEYNYDLSSLKHVVGLDHPDVINRLQEMSGATFWAAYGQSETSGLISFAPYSERPGSAGVPSFMAELETVDDYGNVLKTGTSGEIVVRGPMVFKGYWNLEKDNEYTFRDGWHHTGDLGQIDKEGYLLYGGRSPTKELIKPGGENVYPAEVEKVILEHPLMEEVSVIGVPDPKWGEAIKAICVLKEGELMAENDLIEFVAARIARYKKPKYVVFTSRLPKTEDGLNDRQKIKAEYGKI
ncbi:AMP-binding protein [bacterium]|nr:AMP-binding protein [bacterium]